VTTNKVANELVSTNTTSNESTVNKGDSAKKSLGNFTAVSKTGEAPTGTTTVVTNKVSSEVLTTNTNLEESAAGGNPSQKAAETTKVGHSFTDASHGQ
jgi:hypothetical protein